MVKKMNDIIETIKWYKTGDEVHPFICVKRAGEVYFAALVSESGLVMEIPSTRTLRRGATLKQLDRYAHNMGYTLSETTEEQVMETMGR